MDLPVDGTPANTDGVYLDVTDQNRADGFAPVGHLLTYVEDLDVEASGLAPVTDIGASLADESSLVLLDADSGERLAAWAELDHDADPSRQALIIVPAAALPEGHRIVVALRNLVRTDGASVVPSDAMAERLANPEAEERWWIDALARADVESDEIAVAWGFTVASAESLSGRLRHMWDETLAEIGEDGVPPFSVETVDQQDAVRIVHGTLTMPSYLTGDGGPGEVLANDDDPDGIPTRTGELVTDFTCTVPHGADSSSAPSLIYGHGLLGSRSELVGIGAMASGAGVVVCGVDWLGMSSADVPAITAALADLSAFRTVPDRLHQAHLSVLLLGRLLRSPDGFSSHDAFRAGGGDGPPILDPEAVSYLGASQGGILGAPASALTTDWENVGLVVGAMGYNLLLSRSIDFDPFFPVLAAAYPDPLEQVLLLELIELLWQRGENAGYAQHLTADPYPDVTAKKVLLFEAFGDHQVANVATQRLARTLGIERLAPTLEDGRSPDVVPHFGIDPTTSLPHAGSALVVWDFGGPAPPIENTPPSEGRDPHGLVTESTSALALLISFQMNGEIIDACGGQPCQTILQ